jgi:Asp-tRNA(Asn)/Glu-tRNA(Gln) amidotransferase A subunit family amidase
MCSQLGVTKDKKLPVGIEILALPDQDRLLLQSAETLLHCFQNKCIESRSVI